MNNSNSSLLISQLTAQILTRDMASVNAIVDNVALSNDEKINTLTAIITTTATTAAAAAASSSLLPTTTVAANVIATPMSVGDVQINEAINTVVADTIAENGRIVANNYKMRYNVVRMGVNFIKRYPKYYNVAIAQLVDKIENCLKQYENYVNSNNFRGYEDYENILSKAEELYAVIDANLKSELIVALEGKEPTSIGIATPMDVDNGTAATMATIDEAVLERQREQRDREAIALAALDAAIIESPPLPMSPLSSSSSIGSTAVVNNADINIPTAFNKSTVVSRYNGNAQQQYTDEDEKYDEAIQSNFYNATVKAVLLRLIAKADAHLKHKLHITTVYQLKKLKNYLNSDTNADDFKIFFNIDDCQMMRNLSNLASKFFNVRCAPDTLDVIIEAFKYYNNSNDDDDDKNIMLSILNGENNRIARAVKKIINEFDSSSLSSSSLLPQITLYQTDYESVKNKNVKALLDVYNTRSAINLIKDENGDNESTNDESDADTTTTSGSSPSSSSGSRRSANRVNRKRRRRANSDESTESSTDEQSNNDDNDDDHNNIEHDYEKERKRRRVEDENFLKLKALEFSKTAINEKLEKIILVTDGMRQLYEYCNCKNSLETLPAAANYASLLKRLNMYNLNHVEMNVNFYELMFPLTLYDDINDNQLAYKLINYIFLSSTYFQNCAKNFYRLRQTFDAYGPFKQIDFMVMFVIKFNFLCDMRNFARTINEMVPNKQPNMKVHNVLVMRDKVVKSTFNKLQFKTFTRNDRVRNIKHLEKLINLMNANYNII
ncbi:vp80 [Catopsilia pomona nucleopolyhedrovirus]|uniref:Vp80 n=1 Tax=Catopsilia pomona nucleopolyhedrovirus TaxID=1850906 RepID=A0A172WZB7_9ABAC|nr:vp80 [Catopsilia pomona nucleopolyhedrovirus]ANF29690.1 vp80 [Catopsilia pomona nucleopolyhedrovirus]